MAIGDATELAPDLWAFELMASATATATAPSGAAAGLDLNAIVGRLGRIPEEMALVVKSTAGSATMTVTCRLWGFDGTDWLPLGTGTGAAKGIINGGAAIDETGTDLIRHTEVVTGLGFFTRVALQVTAIGGTSTAVTAWLLAGKGAHADA